MQGGEASAKRSAPLGRAAAPLELDLSAVVPDPALYHQHQSPAPFILGGGISTPTSQHSPQSVGTPNVLQLTPSQVEVFAGLGLSSLISNPSSPFLTNDPAPSHSSPGFVHHNNGGDMSANVAISNGVHAFSTPGGVSGAAAAAAAIAGGSATVAGGARGPPPLTMDLDLAFPSPPHSGAASTSTSTPSTACRPSYNYYPPPAVVPVVPTPPVRHHPYAHPAHGLRIAPPMSHTQSSSASLPMYFGTPALPTTASAGSSSASADPPAALVSPQQPSPVGNNPAHHLSFSTAPPAPHRIQSAPAHILTLSATISNKGQGVGGASGGTEVLQLQHPLANSETDLSGADQRFGDRTGSGMDEGAYGGAGGAAGMPPEWEHAGRGLHHLRQASEDSGGLSGPTSARDWEGDRSMMDGQQLQHQQQQHQPQQQQAQQLVKLVKSEDSPAAGYFDNVPSSYTYVGAQPPRAYAHSPAPGPSPAATEQDALAATGGPGPAIALVRNRLPILEAALSASASESGNDEEEIWRGVEGAFEELRRVMRGRKEARRIVASGPKGAKVRW